MLKAGDKVVFKDGGGHSHTGRILGVKIYIVKDEKGDIREVHAGDTKQVI